MARAIMIDGVALYKQPWYGSYHSMMDRCYRETSGNYKFYGGRGIEVCEAWHDPVIFAKWAYESGYEKGFWLDRIDSNGNYCPENCKWSTPRQQANNRRNNTVLKFQGEEHTEAEWARILGVKKSLISNRLARGWSVEDTLTKEVQYNARWAK